MIKIQEKCQNLVKENLELKKKMINVKKTKNKEFKSENQEEK